MDALAFARHLTPDNPAIEEVAARYDEEHVVSTLDDERAVNPYLRFNAPDIIALLESRGLPTTTELQRWHGIMSIE
jgi:hydroxyacylglutathione hydrolase